MLVQREHAPPLDSAAVELVTSREILGMGTPCESPPIRILAICETDSGSLPLHAMRPHARLRVLLLQWRKKFPERCQVHTQIGERRLRFAYHVDGLQQPDLITRQWRTRQELSSAAWISANAKQESSPIQRRQQELQKLPETVGLRATDAPGDGALQVLGLFTPR
jgi:hypothetical protein